MSDMSYALKSVTPILRIFDETKAIAFYVDYLGFQIDWEHRFEANLPLYMQISLGACTLHLSEHHGDCCPGAAVRIGAENLEAFHAELGAKDYKYAKPGLETTPWDTRELTVTDPFGNRLIFFEAV
ncbi:glyoxalase superfamily protein [Paenibacillus tyrfis]|uniref:Bleomycin resistance protein n=1 Tax=Paenibacillus tyrfis TaxID=1501230 RepID=A0A081P5M6_9BACL|nr:glyoxalase superfamily protein [Paenibacillus tyrfis]KEQ25999.1 glyoxalase [Paenibacillus tyrfis]